MRREQSLARGGVAHADQARGNAADDGIVRYVADHHGIGADDHVVADVDAAENLRARANLHAITDGGGAEWVGSPAVADRHAMADQAIIAEPRRAVDDDAAVVLDREASADDGGAADGDAAENLDPLTEQHIENVPGRAQPAIADDVARVSEAVDQERPESQPE